MNNIMNISGIKCYEKGGTAYLDLETCARGLGFTETKGNKDYVMWRRIDSYLSDLGFGTFAERPKFIPENIFYRLAMKAKNSVAEAFQAKIADEVIPSIRKHGGYMLNQDNMSREEFLARALVMSDSIIKEREQKILQLEIENENQRNEIASLSPMATYCETVLQCKKPIAITVIAKDYGWSGQRMNKELQKRGIQYYVNKTWVLNQKYADKGYTKTITSTYDTGFGYSNAKIQTYWTQEGRMFIYEILKDDGILPIIEAA